MPVIDAPDSLSVKKDTVVLDTFLVKKFKQEQIKHHKMLDEILKLLEDN